MLTNAKRLYQLGTFTVELRAKGWFFWPSYGDKSDAKGPYSSTSSLTLMIARQMKREISRRDAPYRLEG